MTTPQRNAQFKILLHTKEEEKRLNDEALKKQKQKARRR